MTAALVGAELNHYKVVAQLAKGGMGEVFLAEDTPMLGRACRLWCATPNVG